MALLANHIAAVTGAGSGIGRAIAAGYAREGAQVAVLDIDGKAAEATAQAIRDAGGRAESFALDVTRREDCIAVAKRIAEQVGQVSILVNNAGIARRNGMPGAPEAVVKDWEDIIAINLTGVFNVTHAFLAPLRAAKGRIVNIGSIQSFMHLRTPSSPAYTASKHGVLGFTRALAAELGKDGVRVNAIGPGFIETPLNEKVRANNPDLVKIFIDHTPLGRAGKPEDIVGPAIFLASDLSAYVTGFDRDGGRRIPDDLGHVQRPAFQHRRANVLGRSLPGSREDAEAGADRLRAAARLDRLHPARRHLHPGKAHRRVLLAPAGRTDEPPDGPQHDAQGRRGAYERARRDVSGGVAAHGARHLDQAVQGPCRPHPRRARARRPRRPDQGVRAAAVGGMPEGHHRAHQHAL